MKISPELIENIKENYEILLNKNMKMKHRMLSAREIIDIICDSYKHDKDLMEKFENLVQSNTKKSKHSH